MNNALFKQKYGPWVLIVGGSKGIGQAYAKYLAAMGLNLVLTARGESELTALATDLRQRYGVKVSTVCVDLNDADVMAQLAPVVDELDIGLLIYNTAFYDIRSFLDTDIDSHLRTLNVNCRSLLCVVHHIGSALCCRGRGGVIIMSSMSGWQGASLLTTYAASKAFDTVLGEGLWAELRGHGVDVLSFVAGATKTPNFLAMTPEAKQKQAFPMTPDQVAREALQALGRKPIERAGAINKIASFVLVRLLPRRWAVLFMSRSNNNLYGP